jgi:ketosteroid isomerase-like protein
MPSPSAHESKLLEASKAFDEAISKKDVSRLPQLLAKDVVLHHDGITLGQDITGADAVSAYIQEYPNKYHYESHDVIAGAVDENDNIAFSFWLDKGVKPAGAEQGAKSTDTVGIWHHVFNKDDQISNIWFLRQLSHDELENKMKEAPAQKTQFDPAKYRGSSAGQSEDQAAQYDKAARAFNNIWATGDPSAAKDIMTDDVSIYDPVMGSETNSRENFENMIQGFAKSWTTRQNKSHVAVTAGDKAFISWSNTGASKDGPEESLYGLNLLTFNSDGKINDVIGFRQLTKGESEAKVKPAVQKT